MAKSVLSEQEQQRISAAVAEAEKHTSGEIVPVVIRESSDYAVYELVFALISGFIYHSVLLVFYKEVSQMISSLFWLAPEWYVTAFYGISTVLVIGLVYFFSNVPVIDRLIIPGKVRRDAVRKRALLYFAESGLTGTRDRTGILIFVSLLEKRVEVLGDMGINEKISQAEWDSIAGSLAGRIGQGELAEGFCDAIHQCGKKLSEYFPVKPDDANELPNRVDMPEK